MFGISSFGKALTSDFQNSDTAELFLQMDTLGVNWDAEWGSLGANEIFGPKIKGISPSDGLNGVWPGLIGAANHFKQIIYCALPFRLGYAFAVGWKYNEVTRASAASTPKALSEKLKAKTGEVRSRGKESEE